MKHFISLVLATERQFYAGTFAEKLSRALCPWQPQGGLPLY
jgi:hypothetical protein